MSWFTLADLAALLPVIALTVGALVVLILDASSRSEDAKAALYFITVGAILAAAAAVAAVWSETATLGGGAMHLGPYAAFLSLVILGAGAVTVLYSSGYARALGFELGEYFGLLQFSLAGAVYLTVANDLVTTFIAFELMSLSIYGLVAINRGDRRGYEGAMKYFVLGSFSSAFLIYGMALLYGATGTIYFDQMRWLAEGGSQGLALASIGLLLVGFAFKIGAVPFHSWIPDAYQGAPASVTGFMAVAVKAAAFAILIRVLVGMGYLLPAAGVQVESLTGVLWVLAFVTMVLGNFIALAQENFKRLMAYSGIAHSGYVLLGVVAATRQGGAEGITGALFYLAGYGVMTLGVFCVLTVLRQGGRDLRNVSDLAGLARERPGAALCLTICLMSLVGLPPTVGFIGKLWVFKAAIEGGLTGLVVVACLATAVSIYYYLRPVVLMFTAEPKGIEQPEATFGNNVALVLTTGGTLLLGILPASVYVFASKGIQSLLS